MDMEREYFLPLLVFVQIMSQYYANYETCTLILNINNGNDLNWSFIISGLEFHKAHNIQKLGI